MKIDRSLALEMARITEAAAVESGRWVGRGNKTAADAAATTAMRDTLNHMDIDGTVVMRSASRTIRFIETLHYFDYKPGYIQ